MLQQEIFEDIIKTELKGQYIHYVLTGYSVLYLSSNVDVLFFFSIGFPKQFACPNP